MIDEKTTQLSEVYSEPWTQCQKCAKATEGWDWIDKKIYHDNGHVWPGFAGEPTGDNFGGSDF